MNLAWFRMGAWALVIVGVGHLGIVFLASLRRPRASQERDAYLRAQVVPVLGRNCNLRDMYAGFSVVMGLLFMTLGAADLLLGVMVPPSLGWLNLGVSVVLLGISIRAFPPPPIVVLSVASVCFGLAL